MTDRSDSVRLAELVAALSLGIDLGFGQPMEHVLRQCLIALRLAERVGLNEQERATVYYTALLVNVGCHTDAHEQARWFGDDIALKADKYTYGIKGVRSAVGSMRRLGSGHPLMQRFRIGIEFATVGARDMGKMVEHHAEMARLLAEHLGLADDVVASLASSYELWDGKGWPGELRGDAIPVAARISMLAEFVEVAHRIDGIDGARRLARKQSGKQFDPELTATIGSDAELILAGLDEAGTWDAVIEAEPALAIVVSGERFDEALLAVADFIDLKSPYTVGHSRAVAELATEAGGRLTLADDDLTTLRRAAIVHDFGRLGVSNAIWDKRGPLGAGEWERVRMHPYITQRMLQQSLVLGPLGAIAVQHRERLDGSGYPGALAGAAIGRLARILGAADAYQAMREPRPYRPPLAPDDAAAELRSEAKAGRLDGDVVEAVLGAAGHRVARRREGPDGLTAREMEVLRHLARGFTNKDIAAVLVISAKTVSNHIEHIYTKIGASSRAAASLYATRHGLLSEEESVSTVER